MAVTYLDGGTNGFGWFIECDPIHALCYEFI